MRTSQYGTYLVARISILTKNVKQISGANKTNSFQACSSVLYNARPLSFKNQNANNQCFKMRYWENWRNLPKNRGRKSSGLKQICYARITYPLAFFVNFDILVPLREPFFEFPSGMNYLGTFCAKSKGYLIVWQVTLASKYFPFFL